MSRVTARGCSRPRRRLGRARLRWCRKPRRLRRGPQAEAARLDGLDLPDADLYDRLFRLHRALAAHDRAAAVAEAGAIGAAASPDHVLAISAARSIAGYDEDAEAIRACA